MTTRTNTSLPTALSNSLHVQVWLDESGVTAIEYGLLAALIVVAAIAGMSAAGTAMVDMYNFWSSAVAAAVASAF